MRARVSALLLVVCLVAVVVAQERGFLRGVVTDTSGDRLPGVAVSLRGSSDSRSTLTNEKGEFVFAGVPFGAYELTFELAGFRNEVRSVAFGAQTRPLSIQMGVGSLAETVTVTSESLMVDTGRSRATARTDRSYPAPRSQRRERDTRDESYGSFIENPFLRAGDKPLSTFSIDVDTAGYANVRRFLNEGSLPPTDAVRIEELINYFHFDYPQPSGDTPFSITTELADCPWNPKHQLALIGLQGRQLPEGKTPPRSLVFLVDVSGSMDEPDKLPLVQHGLRMLAGTLTAADRVAIVVYAGNSGVVLPSTSGDQRERIDRAIADLRAGGSTNGAEGIRLAYQIARDQFAKGGTNRVILATDGDFNVGVTNYDDLVKLIEHERESGVFLSVLGVGTENLKDSTMEMLADKGNGNYSYLDSLQEARRVLVKEAGGTLVTIAKDVKLQIEFNPANVGAYRLIGYENRLLADEDFNDDRKDAGELGAGHTVTALYEIVPPGVDVEDRPSVDALKYAPQKPEAAPRPNGNSYSNELLTVKLRYKAPDSRRSQLTSAVVTNRPSAMGANLGFASAVAEAGMLLRASKYAGHGSYEAAMSRARKFRGDDPDGYRAEFIRLVEIASSLAAAERRH